TRALNSGLSMLPALLLGTVTAVGGGALRDVLSGRTPKVFEGGELYAIVAAIAADVFLLCSFMGITAGTATGVSVAAGFFLRLLGLRFGWQTKAIRSNSRGDF
ncbi:MAG TPA: TRIC cation channel family protein, partial [Candidatus Acidoferrum sp.]|nr:TRIC cation channel family protein [Candidatus Acidoferrum sp.]